MSRSWMYAGWMIVAVALGGCGSGGDDDDMAAGADAMAAAADADPSGGTADAAPTGTPDATPTGSTDAAPTAMATLSGTITRSAEPQNGGVGTIYVAVFANNPVTDMSQTPVGRTLIEDADMTASDASVAYSVADVPPRSEPYHVVAFLDDNATVDASDPAAAGPDKGDLMSMNGLESPTVVVDSATTVTFDLDLNFAFPF